MTDKTFEADDIKFVSAGPSEASEDGKSFDMVFKSEDVVRAMAYHFGELLDKPDVVNYIEMSFLHQEKGKIVVTIHKPGGKTPHALRMEAEEELKKYKEMYRQMKDFALSESDRKVDTK